VNQAGWKCGECRRHGLEVKRRCAWLPAALATPRQVVWVGKGVSAESCPKSLITAQSIGWVEEHEVWRRLGSPELNGLTARQVEAFLLLEGELLKELNHGQE
jgi:hypothetical protein